MVKDMQKLRCRWVSGKCFDRWGDVAMQTPCRGIPEAFGDEWGNFGLYCYTYCTAIRDCPPLWRRQSLRQASILHGSGFPRTTIDRVYAKLGLFLFSFFSCYLC